MMVDADGFFRRVKIPDSVSQAAGVSAVLHNTEIIYLIAFTAVVNLICMG